MSKDEGAPYGTRRGRLKNDNRAGDLSQVRRCGALRRKIHLKCLAPAMGNGRCRIHGGLSTGPKTPEGKLKAARANLKHGFYSEENKAERKELKQLLGEFGSITEELKRE